MENEVSTQSQNVAREHWIQRITFSAETNAACGRYMNTWHMRHGGHTHSVTLSDIIPSLA